MSKKLLFMPSKKLALTSFVNIAEDDGIIEISFNPAPGFHTNNLPEYLLACKKTYYGKPRPLLFDIHNIGEVSPEVANELLKNKELNKATKAVAILYHNPSYGIQLILNLVLKLEKKPFPIKAFGKREEAINWLQQFKEKETKKVKEIK